MASDRIPGLIPTKSALTPGWIRSRNMQTAIYTRTGSRANSGGRTRYGALWISLSAQIFGTSSLYS